MLEVDQTMLARYNRAGPRYTSYPTVPVWRTEFGEPEYRAALTELSADHTAPLSLYLHLPFCAERCFYCGCNATSTRQPAVVDAYLDRLEREMGMVAGLLGSRRWVVQMHWGGGTPNFLSERQLRRLFGMLERHFVIDRSGEISVEIDPRIADAEQIVLLQELGFNRISLGVQDLDPRVQAAIGRIQPLAQTQLVYSACREAGFRSVNLDLVYGLPYQTAAGFQATLEQVLSWRPDRLACFSYAHVPWAKPNQKRVDTTGLPDATDKLGLFLLAIEMLGSAGYDWIGMDHFALQDDELALAARERRLRRTFMGYTVLPAPHLLAFGMSGIGELAGCYVQSDAHLGRYQRAVDAGKLPVVRGYRLSSDDLRRRTAIMHLMCNLELPDNLALDAQGTRLADQLAAELQRLQPLVGEGLLERRAESLQVTRLGRLFVRNIAMELDAHLEPAGAQPVFSRTI